MQRIQKPRKPNPDTYAKVFDPRKRRVRGMRKRNGRFFGNVTVADDLGRKTSRMVPLTEATVDEAKDDYRRLLVEREDDRLRPLGLSTALADYVSVYTQQLAVSGKRASTVQKETAYLSRWSAKLGHVRLNKLTPRAASGRIAKSSRSTSFHDLRHYVISYALMSGVDFMTPATATGRPVERDSHRRQRDKKPRAYKYSPCPTHARDRSQCINFGTTDH